MPFDDHLGPQQDIRLLGRKGGKNLFIASLAPGGIRIHAQDPCLRKFLPQILFYFFRSRPHSQNIAGTALGAGAERRPLISAVMADQPPVAVE